MRRLTLLLALILGLAGARAAAQTESSVEAELSRTSVYVGDEVIYQVVVRGQRPADRPVVEFPPSVRAQEAGSSESSFRSMRIIDGQRTVVVESSVTYQYRLTVLQPGVVEIPPAEVKLQDGTRLRSGPARFDALLPQLASGFEIWMELDRQRLYLGETVTAQIVWMIPESVGANFDFDTSVFDPSLRIVPVEPAGTGRRLNEFRFLGRRAFATAETVFDSAGRQRIRFAFDVEITPTEPGRRQIGPIRVVFDRAAARDGRTRAYTESDPIAIEVLDLPTEGRPDGFSGLIGSYELRTLANPTTVNVGDPITLRAELRGEEPMVGADSLPPLGGQPGFERFRLSSEGWREEQARTRGRRVFATTIRALSDEITEIPPVRVWSFDPRREAYVEVASEPVQLDVRAVREATLADAVVSPGARAGRAATPDRIGPSDAAFWAAPTAAEIAATTTFDARRALTSPAALVAVGSGPAAILAAGTLVLARRRRERPGHALDRALRHAEHTVLRSGPAAGVRAATAAVLGCDPGAVTAADAERLPVHPGLTRTLRETLLAEEIPEAASSAPAPGDVRLAIRTLKRELRRREGTA